MAVRKKATEATEATEMAVEQLETVDTPAVEEVKEAPAPKAEKKAAVETAKGVVSETTHQLGIFSDYIYNARNEGVDIVVENLGYGDVYVHERGVAKVGDLTQRLTFGESRTFPATSKVYAASASQPVIQILELK
ncbi:hypothetical protein IAQ67_28355 (plasmid) [Paenibacillus peoriae]|uniref:Uncharacterized protein n=1 Tax=Paenibacillus peoriae TaxID=59893 RepID=A0A7H0YH73_9BACL|nr:hypothetical protein [Paenibacillus peoriae]QNR70431.1 hypothetical protein IAQ67_28355 [Paenibacillus peoriae]